MHSLNHVEFARTHAAERTRRSTRKGPRARHHRPPPLRVRVAFAAARIASRLDAESARRAVA
ncbi:MAG TPA: hypothetical protein VN213_15785 [Solirubrobacteraceae bacterium]|nr:hypothetical protein [Solirubrobacteraceae bacterium]